VPITFCKFKRKVKDKNFKKALKYYMIMYSVCMYIIKYMYISKQKFVVCKIFVNKRICLLSKTALN